MGFSFKVAPGSPHSGLQPGDTHQRGAAGGLGPRWRWPYRILQRRRTGQLLHLARWRPPRRRPERDSATVDGQLPAATGRGREG
jgi:hypothetical protein